MDMADGKNHNYLEEPLLEFEQHPMDSSDTAHRTVGFPERGSVLQRVFGSSEKFDPPAESALSTEPSKASLKAYNPDSVKNVIDQEELGLKCVFRKYTDPHEFLLDFGFSNG